MKVSHALEMHISLMVHAMLKHITIFGIAGSPCTNTDKPEYNILPVEAGSLLSLAPPEVQPPAVAPLPPLDSADVVDPPLPPVANISTAGSPIAEAPQPSASISFANVAKMDLSLMAIMVLSLLSMLN